MLVKSSLSMMIFHVVVSVENRILKFLTVIVEVSISLFYFVGFTSCIMGLSKIGYAFVIIIFFCCIDSCYYEVFLFIATISFLRFLFCHSSPLYLNYKVYIVYLFQCFYVQTLCVFESGHFPYKWHIDRLCSFYLI